MGSYAWAVTYACVAAGGALGSMARLWLGIVIYEWIPGRFPLGTLLINILGSFVIGWFDVLTGGKPLNTWTYQIAPAGEGSDVTESFRLADTWSLKLYWALLGWARGRTNRNGMRATLEAIRAEVERTPA